MENTNVNVIAFRRAVSIFSENRKIASEIFSKKRFDTAPEDFFHLFEGEEEEVKLKLKEFTQSTLKQLYAGKFWGEGFISPLSASFREALITSDTMDAVRLMMRQRRALWFDTEYLNLLSFPYLANIHPEEKHFSEAFTVIPLMETPYPWFFIDENRLNFKAFNFMRDAVDLSLKKSEVEEFDGKWRLDPIFDDFRRVLRKYIFKEKNIYPEKISMVKRKGFDTFYLIECKGILFFGGKTKDYLKIHRQYIEPSKIKRTPF